jgi:hypothetical protein
MITKPDRSRCATRRSATTLAPTSAACSRPKAADEGRRARAVLTRKTAAAPDQVAFPTAEKLDHPQLACPHAGGRGVRLQDQEETT